MANLDAVINDLKKVDKLCDEILVKQENILANQKTLQLRAAEQRNGADLPQHSGGLTLGLIQMVNSLGNIVIDISGKGYVSGNDLDFANDCLDKVIPLLPPS